ncbi:hypothetical protein J6590_097925, partial [Homalodisca vitripennis]
MDAQHSAEPLHDPEANPCLIVFDTGRHSEISAASKDGDPDLAYPSNWWPNIKPLFSLFNNRPPTDAVIASAADLTLLHRRVRWN